MLIRFNRLYLNIIILGGQAKQRQYRNNPIGYIIIIGKVKLFDYFIIKIKPLAQLVVAVRALAIRSDIKALLWYSSDAK